MKRHAHLPKRLFGAVLALCSSCYHWQAATPYVALPSHARIQLRNRVEVEGEIVRRTTDSLFLQHDDSVRALAIGDIRTIETRSMGVSRRVLAIGAAAALGAVFIVKARADTGSGGITIRR